MTRHVIMHTIKRLGDAIVLEVNVLNAELCVYVTSSVGGAPRRTASSAPTYHLLYYYSSNFDGKHDAENRRNIQSYRLLAFRAGRLRWRSNVRPSSTLLQPLAAMRALHY